MISAKEAAQLSVSKMENALEKEIKFLEDSILKVCNKGIRSFKIYSKISQQAKKRLISEGFNVQEYDSQRDGYIGTISW